MSNIVSIVPETVFGGYPNLAAWYRYVRRNSELTNLYVSWEELTDLEVSTWIDHCSGVRVPQRALLNYSEVPILVAVIIKYESLGALVRLFQELDPEVQGLLERACEIFWAHKNHTDEGQII